MACCPKCDAEMLAGDRKCPKCGYDFPLSPQPQR
jgi:hypothetical protein